MNWFTKIFPGIKTKKIATDEDNQWEKCPKCNSVAHIDQLEKCHWICTNCDYHIRLTIARRCGILFDENYPINEIGNNIHSVDFLDFKDSETYQERLTRAQQGDSRKEAAAAFRGFIKEREAVVVIFDFNFMGGSMGSVAGERFVRAVEAAIRLKLPFISFTASGGARMQEGLISLLQMAKTTAALAELARQQLPHINVLTDPTTGGVAASFALIGDIIIAEPEALIGFAGPRVIKETVREELPEGFQRSEFLLKHGAIDMIVDRREIRDTLHKLITLLLPSSL